jgi:GNAT superfamily N-acetyltransferase
VSGSTAPARRDDLRWIAPAAVRARVIEDAGELAELWGHAPWRVRVTTTGEAAVLGPWRDHLDLCAVFGLWCSTHRIPLLIGDLCAVATDQGFERLLGPLVSEEVVEPYLAAGLQHLERILVMRLEPLDIAGLPCTPPANVTVRVATPPDLLAVLAVDGAAFDDFWRYDERLLGKYARSERLSVAEEGGRLIGYTLATTRAGEGSLGRLAVVEEWRGRGVGRALACDAVRWMAASGASAVTLSTQEANEPSQRLYRSLGFRRLPGALVSTVSAPLQTAG